MQPRRLAILGVGLLGGSIGLAVRSRLIDCVIAAYGHRRHTLEAARKLGAVDEVYDHPEEAVAGADLVILCTPVGVMGSLLQQIAPHLADAAVVTDVGSTKRSVVQAAERLLSARVGFVGSHPMAGGEKAGVQFAQANLFQGSLCFITPTQQTAPAALARVEEFWKLLGMRVMQLSPESHDRLLSDVSHLPHAVAAALVNMQQDEALDLCGKGFLDLTRIASGDGGLWRDILLDNRDNLRQSLRTLSGQLQRLEKMLEDADSQSLRDWLGAAAARRRTLIDRKQHPPQEE